MQQVQPRVHNVVTRLHEQMAKAASHLDARPDGDKRLQTIDEKINAFSGDNNRDELLICVNIPWVLLKARFCVSEAIGYAFPPARHALRQRAVTGGRE